MLRALIFFILFAPVLLAGQPIQFSLSPELASDDKLLALLVSNQYGVLRFYKIMEEGENKDGLTFSVQRRLGEELALTLVEEREESGYFTFRNTTYRNLSNGVQIGKTEPPVSAEPRYRLVGIAVEGVDGVEEVVVPAPVGIKLEYQVRSGNLAISFSVAEEADVFVLIRLKGEDSYRYFYAPQDEDNLFTTSASQLKTDLVPHAISLPKSGSWEGSINARNTQTGKKCWVYNSSQMGNGRAGSMVAAYLPGGQTLTDFQLQLSHPGPDSYQFYGQYKEELPAILSAFEFDPLLTGQESKAFKFKVEEEQLGRFFEVSYRYDLGAGLDAHWNIWGAMETAGEVDFILPDLPAELSRMIPELEALAQPVSVVKRSLRCTENCDYDFSLQPHLLQREQWCLEHGVQVRGQEVEF